MMLVVIYYLYCLASGFLYGMLFYSPEYVGLWFLGLAVLAGFNGFLGVVVKRKLNAY